MVEKFENCLTTICYFKTFNFFKKNVKWNLGDNSRSHNMKYRIFLTVSYSLRIGSH